MRWRPLIWLLLSLLVLAVLLPVGANWRRNRGGDAATVVASVADGPREAFRAAPGFSAPSAPGTRFRYRLSNTTKTIGQLARSDRAILLENALLDTEQPIDLPIPSGLRAQGEPGSFIVQSRSTLDQHFRLLLEREGATIAAYIPNNAYLVRASAGAARSLANRPEVQAVLPYEPYYKLKPSLLAQVIELPPERAPLSLNILLFRQDHQAALAALKGLNVDVLAEEASPFGPWLRVQAALGQVPALAGLIGVQELELSRARISANDLSRVAIGVATDSVTSSNYLGLTGTNILVNVNDTGVDAAQPDLSGRVSFDFPVSGVDSNGHGTHVAGIIAASGVRSTNVSSAPGSSSPPVPFQFRGQAPAAKLFSVAVGSGSGPAPGDAYLQQIAAQTNALISNNSWHYADDNDYDLAAASYDAAVRDALPGVSGPQPMLFVFAAGNSGGGNDNGFGGNPGTIQSPGTAKNVITVGAVEQRRFITNATWTCATTCQTNVPWLGMTDSSNQVAAFSSRGNVGIGTEGAYGRFKPDLVAPGTFIISTRSGEWADTAYYADTNNAFTSKPDANYFEVLSNLNQSLRPYYRFESGSSLAAAEVSGALALMQEFYRARLGRTNSPALMKALLINGARSLGGSYDLQAASLTNFQGWGIIRLPNSAPAALTNGNSSAHPMVLVDQNPADALATGQSKTRYVSLSAAARNQPLRFTLAWTDPPASPLASLKLVNDLDLIVTNLDTGSVFFGNDIPPGSQFNLAWETDHAPNLDFVNNVENVFLSTPLAANYSVTIQARRVNVNAVTARTNGIVQDYALVISSGDGQVGNALTVTEAGLGSAAAPLVTSITNTFSATMVDWGTVLLRQRAGANAALPAANSMPLPGSTNAVLTIGSPEQWHFYVVTNAMSFTNAVFLTFPSSTLSLAAPVVITSNSLAWAELGEADIDLYVSRDSALTNLDPSVLAAADMSLGRGSSETIVYSNATPGVYYVGVKCESQAAAEYGFLVDFSELPFAQDDGFGNEVLRGLPAPAQLPGGTSAAPGRADLFCVDANPIMVRRAVVTNTVTHPNMAELAGILSHGAASVVLNRHSPAGPVTQQSFIYDDSGEGDIPGTRPTDGPGSLRSFYGAAGLGQWRLTMTDTNQPGTNENLTVFLERQPDLGVGVTATILPGACREDFVYVPPEATNLTASVNLVTGQGPLSLQLCPADMPATNCVTLQIAGTGGSAALTADASSHPPLNAGLYVLRVCNLDAAPVSVNNVALLVTNPLPPTPWLFTAPGPLSILDDAITPSTLLVTNLDSVASAAVGVRINHPRVSDLVLRLVSPKGTSVLLVENRGGSTTNGMGGDLLITNVTPVSYNGGPESVTNVFDTGQNSGTLTINYDFFAFPDTMHVYYDGQLLWDSGLVSYTGVTNLHYGPGSSTLITIIMNEGGNLNSNTAWFYKLTSTRVEPMFLTFSENTNFASTPIKFASAPFTNINYFGTVSAPSNALFYLPEESLDKLAGEPAFGAWTLEISDTRAGATNPPPALISWQLGLLLRSSVPVPLPLTPGQASTNALGVGQIQWFTVDVPGWASFASNTLLAASAPVNVWFNPAVPPTGTNAADWPLLLGSTAGSRLLQTNGTPPLNPGTRYYLGIQNTNLSTVTFAWQVSFDVASVVLLQDGVPYSNLNPGPANAADYYLYVVATNIVRAQFELNSLTADLTLIARKGLPLPTLTQFDFLSANPGTNDELVVVYDYSRPVPLTPGNWFLAAVNAGGPPAAYSILATGFSTYGTNISVSNASATTNAFCFSWTSLPGIHYYVQGKTSLQSTNWITVSATLTANDVQSTYCVALPSQFQFFRIHEGIVLTP